MGCHLGQSKTYDILEFRTFNFQQSMFDPCAFLLIKLLSPLSGLVSSGDLTLIEESFRQAVEGKEHFMGRIISC